MKFGTLFAYWTNEWKGDYSFYARKVSELGFDILEISAGQLLTMSNQEIDELKALTKELGITITSNIGPAKDKDIASKDPAIRKAGIESLTDIMKSMDRLDSRALVGVLYSFWPSDFTDLDKEAIWARGVISVKELAKTAEALGIDYCLEVVNRFETNILNTSEEAVQYCKDVDSKNVKMLLDTFHMNIEEDNFGDAIRLAGDYLGHLHVGEGNRKVPGKGHLPWTEIGQALKDINYDKGIVMEPFVHAGGQVGKDIKVWRDLSSNADLIKMDQDIKDSLNFLKKSFLR
ncbi:MAG: D-psicose 3-epimerase [Ruminiclostridium sp.]